MLVYKINPNKNFTIDEDGRSSVKINVPLGMEFSTDAQRDLISDEMFFEKIKADVLPPITDMEKIVVYPAVYNGEDKPLSLANEIEINFHFRRRWYEDGANRIITDGWLTNDTYGWTTGYPGSNSSVDGGELVGYDEMSDLVGYLGFDDDDIYYQKTKVKKSFLRLLFYDSMSVLNKNLVTYSTAFVDSGKLFTKYSLIRNNEELYKYVMESDRFNNEMVMFEPGANEENVKYENLRMSSMVTLKDKYNDDASSDGFYLYLYRRDAPSEKPVDLYLKGEFNNAKYGKTVNLMIPVGDDGVPVRFIDDDFPSDFVIEESGKTNFDFDRYYKSMFINLKCKYDKELKKYVYYFPWDPSKQKEKMAEHHVEYTVSNDIEKKKITLNFFEPRINRTNVIEP